MTKDEIIYAIYFLTLLILILIVSGIRSLLIANKKELQMQADYEKELRAVSDEVQEQVLVNVGRELHDNIGQLLTVIHLQLEHSRMDMPELQPRLKPIDDTLQHAMLQLRSLAKSLNNDLLEHGGLLPAVAQEVNRLKTIGRFDIHWTHDKAEPRLNKDQRLMSFRILQEVLNNTIKHAEAQNVYVSMQGTGSFRLEVRDDGKGFDMEKQQNLGGGSGLKNIIKRAALANFTCSIQSHEGKGSIFILQEPDR